MELYRCRCGQPLAAFVSGAAGAGLPIGTGYVAREVRAALVRHLDQVAATGLDDPADIGPISRHGLVGVEPGLALSIELETRGHAELGAA